ncbi:hypothetical protein VDGD_21596 [Verticillium dahliae]|nr:hypothetical protein VDGD_21596 [Verticillium dahliae]
MGPVRFALEVEHGDSVCVVHVDFIFRHALRVQVGVVVEADDRVVALELPVELVLARLVHPNSTALGFVSQICPLNERLDEVLNDAILGNQEVQVVLLAC